MALKKKYKMSTRKRFFIKFINNEGISKMLQPVQSRYI